MRGSAVVCGNLVLRAIPRVHLVDGSSRVTHCAELTIKLPIGFEFGQRQFKHTGTHAHTHTTFQPT